MGLFDAFRYDGKRALVVGGATGMGAAVAELVLDAGAEVIVMDRADITLDGVKAIHLDLSDTASIDAAIAELGGPINALFSCAGVADGTPGIERINFLGHRYMIEKLLEADLLPRGSAIGMISSAAGLGWENSLDEVKAYLDIADFHEAAQWARDNNKADYMWSKKSVCAYVAREAFPLLQKGIRINAILPGPTNTPLAQANAEHVADVRPGLPGRDGHRGLHAARAGLPTRLPLQRRRGRGQRHHDRHRCRLRVLGRHRLVPRRHPGRRLPPGGLTMAFWHEENLLIDGELVPAEGGRTFETLNPATGQVLGVAADASLADTDRAIQAARTAFDTTDWSTDHELRQRCLHQLHEALVRHTEDLRPTMIAEVGCPVMLTEMAALETPIEIVRWYADLLDKFEWSEDLGVIEFRGAPHNRWVEKEAVGVVAAIVPYNYPLQITLAKVGAGARRRLHRRREGPTRHAVGHPVVRPHRRRDRSAARRPQRDLVERRRGRRGAHHRSPGRHGVASPARPPSADASWPPPATP